MDIRTTLRLATRSVTKRPLFSAVVIVTLGLAIGATSAVFSLIDAALLRPLNVEKPNELLDVYTTDSAGHGFGSSSYPDFAYVRENARGVADVFGYSGLITTMAGGQPEVLFGEIVTGNYFSASDHSRPWLHRRRRSRARGGRRRQRNHGATTLAQRRRDRAIAARRGRHRAPGHRRGA